MYTIREFAKKRINNGVFARLVLFLSGIVRLLTPNSFARFSLRSNLRLHKAIRIARRRSLAVIRITPFADCSRILAPKVATFLHL